MNLKPYVRQYGRILQFTKPYKFGFLLSGLIMLVFAASNIYLMPLSRDLSSEIGNKNLMNLAWQIFNGCLLFGLRLASQFGQMYLSSKLTGLIVIDMRLKIYEKLLSHSQGFYSRWKLGTLLNRMFGDVDRVYDAIRIVFSDVLPQLLTFIGVFSYLFYLNWKLTLFMIVEVPIFIAIISYTTSMLKKTIKKSQEKNDDITHIAQETLSNVKLVQAYTQEEKAVRRFRQENMRSFTMTMKGILIRVKMEPAITYLQFVGLALMTLYGSYQVTVDALTAPELISFVVGTFLLIDPVLALTNGYAQLQQALVSVERYFEIMDEEEPIQNPEESKGKTDIQGIVEFKNCGFSYPDDDETVLDDVTITTTKSEVTALVGLSGAGKTTLINLIPRFFDPVEGQVLIDGVDVRDYDLKTLRSQIGIVPQEDILFRGTIFENVRYGRSDAKVEEVIEALKLANAWEFVEKMPKKAFTKVGDRGSRLSGGQKQRISIARALLKDPKILILDEATSALDSKSEKLVQDALDNLMKSRTTFVIAHRLSTIMNADRIVVLEKGRIMEVGKHEDLLKKNGPYASLYNLQFRDRSKVASA